MYIMESAGCLITKIHPPLWLGPNDALGYSNNKSPWFYKKKREVVNSSALLFQVVQFNWRTTWAYASVLPVCVYHEYPWKIFKRMRAGSDGTSGLRLQPWNTDVKASTWRHRWLGDYYEFLVLVVPQVWLLLWSPESMYRVSTVFMM